MHPADPAAIGDIWEIDFWSVDNVVISEMESAHATFKVRGLSKTSR